MSILCCLRSPGPRCSNVQIRDEGTMIFFYKNIWKYHISVEHPLKLGSFNDQLCLLIDQRRNRNAEYYNIPGSSRVDFWNSIANTINQRFGTTYTGQQCNNRFQNLVRDYNVSAKFYILF